MGFISSSLVALIHQYHVSASPQRSVTCDDSRVVFSAGHHTDSTLLEVLDRTRQPRLEDKRPVTELSELTEAERVHVVL